MAQLQALQGRVAQDSRTSHQPPSQDTPWVPKSERRSSGKRSGGQVGHPGKTLKMSEHIDAVEVLPLQGACGCGQGWEAVPAQGCVKRQVHDLPEIRVQIKEYRAEVKVCPRCAGRGQAAFPAHVTGSVQYGPRFRGWTTLLNAVHFIPLERTCEIMQTLCGASPSQGTVDLNLKLAAQRLEGFEQSLKTALRGQAVLHADETGSKVGGKRHWLHVLSSTHFTLYAHHAQRGAAALDAMGVLNTFTGVLMHDCWSAYFKLPAQHALCNAHLLRELRALHEHAHQTWAGDLRVALQNVYHQHKTGTLTPQDRAAFSTTLDRLLEAGFAANPAAPEPIPKKRGPTKQTPARNLALRCQTHKAAYLRFLSDPQVPFDNNAAERDIRMTCVKRKVSGGFRSAAGGVTFCRIRSYISTLKKQGLNVWNGLLSLFAGDLLLPDFSR